MPAGHGGPRAGQEDLAAHHYRTLLAHLGTVHSAPDAKARKAMLKTLAKSLRMPREALSRTLAELPDLAADERIEELIACAAAGSACDDASG